MVRRDTFARPTIGIWLLAMMSGITTVGIVVLGGQLVGIGQPSFRGLSKGRLHHPRSAHALNCRGRVMGSGFSYRTHRIR